jgi:hypothetical protein
MPEKEVLKRAQKDRKEGKSASTQAGEFVREEIHHIREGKHGAKNAKQAIAIGLSKARRAGVPLKVPKAGAASEETRRQAARDSNAAKHPRKPSAKRSLATLNALKDEPHSAASHLALSRHAHQAAEQHTSAERSAAARKAARTRAHER